jgi:hypothetical protein
MDALSLYGMTLDQIACSVAAAGHYHVPPSILLAIAEKEHGQPGLMVPNANGTTDIGPMQFNSAYLASLRRYGISASDVSAPGCYPYQLAGWRLHQHLTHDQGDLWTRAANYHSRTPRYNAAYQADLVYRAHRWEQWLACQQASVPYQAPRIEASTNHAEAAHPAPPNYVARAITASTGQ